MVGPALGEHHSDVRSGGVGRPVVEGDSADALPPASHSISEHWTPGAILSLKLPSPLAPKTPFSPSVLLTLTVPVQPPLLTFPLFSLKYVCSPRLCPWSLLCLLFILFLDNLFSAQSTKSRFPIPGSNHSPELLERWETERRQWT